MSSISGIIPSFSVPYTVLVINTKQSSMPNPNFEGDPTLL